MLWHDFSRNDEILVFNGDIPDILMYNVSIFSFDVYMWIFKEQYLLSLCIYESNYSVSNSIVCRCITHWL